MPANEYPHQSLLLKSIGGEKWKDIPGLESYFMVSNFGRIKRLEYELQYKNGAVYTKPEKIIKPAIRTAKNKFKNDFTRFLVNRVTLYGIRYNLTLSRIVYYCFVANFNLDDQKTLILCRDGDGLNIHPKNLVKSTISDRAKRTVARRRMKSTFKNLSKEFREKQRLAILKTINKRVSQYSLKGKILKTYPSAAAAERATGVFATSIRQRASGKGISCGGYVWRWGNEETVDVESIRQKRKTQHRFNYGQRVTQYNFDGNKIAQFPSLQDAETASGANTNAIRLVLKGVYKSAKGFFWKKGYGKYRIDLSNYKWGKQSMGATQSKPVQQLTPEGKLIKLYPSIKEAADAIKCTPSVIVATCKGKQKTSGGFKWEYA
jgi:NUMOD4 motif